MEARTPKDSAVRDLEDLQCDSPSLTSRARGAVRRNNLIKALALVSVLVFCGPQSGQAACPTSTWDGGGAADDSLFFGGTTRLDPNNDFAASTSFPTTNIPLTLTADSDIPFGITKWGSGALSLSGASTYSGGTTIGAGTLQLSGRNNRLPTDTTLTLGSSSSSSGTFILRDGNGKVDPTLADQVTSGSGTGYKVIGGDSTASAPMSNLSGTRDFSGVPSGSGASQNSIAFATSGAGTLALSGANTYSGGTSLNSGFLRMGHASALGTGLLNLNGGTLDANNFTANNLGALSLSLGSTIQLRSDTTFGMLTFVSAARSGGTLAIDNWTGTAGLTGNDGRTIISSTLGGAFLDNVTWTRVNNGSSATITGALRIGAGGVVPVPEPATVFAGCLLLGLFGWTERRRLRSPILTRKLLDTADR